MMFEPRQRHGMSPELEALLDEARGMQAEVDAIVQMTGQFSQKMGEAAESMTRAGVSVGRLVGELGGANYFGYAAGIAVVGAFAGYVTRAVGTYMAERQRERDLARILPKKQELAAAKLELVERVLPRIGALGERFWSVTASSAAQTLDEGDFDRFGPLREGLDAAFVASVEITIRLAVTSWVREEFKAWLAGQHSTARPFPSAADITGEAQVHLLKASRLKAPIRGEVARAIPIGVLYLLHQSELSERVRQDVGLRHAIDVLARRRITTSVLPLGQTARTFREFYRECVWGSPHVTTRAQQYTLGLVGALVVSGGSAALALSNHTDTATIRGARSPDLAAMSAPGVQRDSSETGEAASGAAALVAEGRAARDGIGTPADDARAAQLFQAACDRGSVEGCALRGMMFLDGRGVPRSPERAASLLERACSGGFHTACLEAAHLYCQGDPSMRNPERGHPLLLRACQAGLQGACSESCVAAPVPAAAPVEPPPAPAEPEPTHAAAASSAGTWRVLPPDSVRASSFIRNARQHNPHPPEHAFDNDPRTAWNENSPGPGDGEWIEAQFRRPMRVHRIRIATGWDASSARHGDLFSLNSHLRVVRFTMDGGISRTIDVGEEQRTVVVEGLDIVTRRVRIDAISVWPGTHWEDLCISDGAIEGEEPETSAPTGLREEHDDDSEGVAAGCFYQTRTSFHLRPHEARTRQGSEPIDTNPRVRLVRRGSLSRGSEGSFFVQLLDGTGREGWIFIPRSELDPSCL